MSPGRLRTPDASAAARGRHILLAAAALLAGTAPVPLAGQGQPFPVPPQPFVDSGACPFEGCVYRDWVATTRVVAYATRDSTGPASFVIDSGQWVRALTGIVVTVIPGRVRFSSARRFTLTGDSVATLSPSDTLYLLTYQGEGFSKVWFRGALFTDVDITDFYRDRCRRAPVSCGLAVLEMPRTVWWVQVRNAAGRTGWVLVHDNFGNMDAFGLPESDPVTAPRPAASRSRS